MASNDTDQSELVTLPAAARRLGVGVRQLRRACERDGLPLYRVGGWPRVRWREVEQWLAEQRVRATPHARQRLNEVLEREQQGTEGDSAA